jgi:putative ABC transport system permease protein
VAVVNEALAQRLWPAESSIVGRRLRTSTGLMEIVGVVKTGKYTFLTEPPKPYLYLPLRQNYKGRAVFHVRLADSVPTSGLVPAMRHAIREMDPEVQIFGVKTMREHLDGGYVFGVVHNGGVMAATLGLLGLGLASIGLYGVVASTVQQRTREIGIRTALGASGRDVLRLVLHRGIVLVVCGSLAGVAIGLTAARLLQKVLFSINPGDSMAILGAFVLLVGVAAAACLIPASKALRADPTAALRNE